MIEAMEQQILNSINSKWTKDKEKRKEIDIDKVIECFRVICSSRSSVLSIIQQLKSIDSNEKYINDLKDNMIKIYDWITEDSIENLIEKYYAPLKNKKKEAEYIAEVPQIKIYLEVLKDKIINETIDKLLLFHGIKKGE